MKEQKENKYMSKQKWSEVFEGENSGLKKEFDKCVEQEVIVEHCDEPNCPECNLVAYNKGREDILNRIEEDIELLGINGDVWEDNYKENLLNNLHK